MPRRSRRGVGLGAILVLLALAPAPPDGPDDATRPDAALRAALDAKIRAASDILEMYRAFLVAPPGERLVPPAVEAAEQIQTWSRLLTDAKLEAATTRDERIKLLTEERDRAREFEAQVKNLADDEAAGTMRVSTAKAAFYRADAEARLARAQLTP